MAGDPLPIEAIARFIVTLPQFRRRGVYLSLVAHRIALAREAGCTAAVVQAQTRSSAPILIERVTTIWGLARPGTETTT